MHNLLSYLKDHNALFLEQPCVFEIFASPVYTLLNMGTCYFESSPWTLVCWLSLTKRLLSPISVDTLFWILRWSSKTRIVKWLITVLQRC